MKFPAFSSFHDSAAISEDLILALAGLVGIPFLLIKEY